MKGLSISLPCRLNGQRGFLEGSERIIEHTCTCTCTHYNNRVQWVEREREREREREKKDFLKLDFESLWL